MRTLARIVALADGDAEIFDYPSAELIGILFRAMVESSAKSGYIAKGSVEAWRKKAEAMHIDGIRATAGYEHCELLLSNTDCNNMLVDMFVAVLSDTNLRIYQSKRRQLAKEFIEGTKELHASKRRGRPRGSSAFNQEDLAIIDAALKAADPNAENVLTDLLDKALREQIATLPVRGETEVENLRTHMRRLKRKIKLPDRNSE